MARTPTTQLFPFSAVSLKKLPGVILLLLSAVSVAAQGVATSPSAAPGAPAGSYALSDLEQINLYNGNLNFNLPLLRMGGRGSAGVPVSLTIEQHWSTEISCESGINPPCYEYPGEGTWSDLPLSFYLPGAIRGRFESSEGNFACDPEGLQAMKTVTGITFIAPDGTNYDLRDIITNGQKQNRNSCNWLDSFNRGRVFATYDGTAATFISDADIRDDPGVGSGVFYPSGYLLLRDGTRYRFDEGVLKWVRDRNGNKVTMTYTSAGLTKITDSLNREVTFEYDIWMTAPYEHFIDKITYKGVSGATRTIQIRKPNLSNALRSGYSIQPYSVLFPDYLTNPNSTYDPYVPSEVELPDGSKYKFRYNSYGELARLELPTGGAVEYDGSSLFRVGSLAGQESSRSALHSLSLAAHDCGTKT